MKHDEYLESLTWDVRGKLHEVERVRADQATLKSKSPLVLLMIV